MRWDPTQKKLRMFRIVWQRGVWGMKDSNGHDLPYSFAVTIGIRPALFSYNRTWDQTRVTLLGVFVNHHRSAGGVLV
jgi:hypothetical protein